MKRIIIVFLVVVLVCAAGFVGWYSGLKTALERGLEASLEKGLERGYVECIREQTLPERLRDSKVVYDVEITAMRIVLKGKVVEVSDRTITLVANGDTLDVSMREGAVAPIKGYPKRPLKMEYIQIGEKATIIAVLLPIKEKFEGVIYFAEDAGIKQVKLR